MIKRVITLLFVNVNIALEIIVGISVYAIIQDMIEDTPIRNTMITVVLAESRMILGRSFALILFINKAKNQSICNSHSRCLCCCKDSTQNPSNNNYNQEKD